MARLITDDEKQVAHELLERGRAAMKCIEDYDQARIDRLCQAVGWATSNAETFTRLANMSVDESGLGDRAGRPNKRFKIMGILRDALRQKKEESSSEEKKQRPRPFQFRYAPKNSPFRLNLAFNKSRIAKEEVVEALENILAELKSGVLDLKKR